MNKIIKNVFNNIPKEKILSLAKNYQLEIKNNKSLIETKAPNDFVTKADKDIQNIILEHFADSALAGSYNIQAEETLEQRYLVLNNDKKDYTLLVDPLDGTGSFCRGESKWGSMVGLYNHKINSLEFSWNLISTGEVFSSFNSIKTDKANKNPKKSFDIYDYGGKSAEVFPQKLEDLSNGKYKKDQILVTSCPTAVWSGFELFRGNLNGLLWLPFMGSSIDEKKGKGHYPNYDLIFIGALINQGFKTLLGKEQEKIQVLAIAESNEDLELLEKIASEILPKEQKINFQSGTSNII